ncbi:carboxypeptidase regulatory-like domain-containing protein [Streptomyces fenghuangensis]
MPGPHPARRRRGRVPPKPASLLSLVLALFVAVLPTTPVLAAVPAAAPAAPSTGKIDPALLNELGTGPTDFYVLLTETADLSRLGTLEDHGKRTARGRAELVRTAERSQHGLLALLEESRTPHTSYWIVNAVHVERGDARLARRIAELPSVREIRQVPDIHLTGEAAVGTAQDAQVAADETAWGVTDIGAPRAWEDTGARGQGVVVATIDTGVNFEHEALAGSYRGNRGDGTYDHDYNWYDPARKCGRPSLKPCDNNGHGTHTTGTIVGGGPHRIGVAPDATWIAAKGCENRTCTTESLLASGQWVIAPTNLAGEKPRPELAPNIVNNSWGLSSHDPFYEEIVRRWTEVGIFPVFAAGNSGPSCDTMGSPADYPTTYAVAAYDADHAIGDFSSRGSTDTVPRPDISAPGVDILSASHDGGYVRHKGTSMAAPHVAGAVAVLWSHSPQLFGDPEATRKVLDASATDVDDTGCGGDADANSVWGEGRLNVPAALAAAPDDPVGTLSLAVTRGDDGTPVSGARVTATASSGRTRLTVTGSDGRAGLVLPVGEYQVGSSAFALQERTRTVTVTENATTETDLPLLPMPTHAVSGRVLDAGGAPVVGSAVRLHDTPLAATTSDEQGRFRIEGVPTGTYRISGGEAGCTLGGTGEVAVTDRDTSIDLHQPARIDPFGQSCYGTAPDPVTTTRVLAITGDDAFGQTDLPFRFPFYQETYDAAWVGTNGFLSFTAGSTMPINSPLPHGGRPNAAVMPFWDDLVIDGSAEIRTGTDGTAPDRRFAVEWRNALIYGTQERVTVQAVLHERGSVVFEYVDLGDTDTARGGSATAGMENADGTVAVPLNANRPWLRPGTAYRADVPAVLRGRVTDLDTGEPIAGVTVRAERAEGAEPRTTTGSDGRYTLPLPYGEHRIVATADGYAPVDGGTSLTVRAPEGTLDLVLDRNSVTGTVVDHRGEPVADAEVTTTGVAERAVRTGPDGGYRIPALPAGDLSVTVRADGCRETGSRTITVDNDERLDFGLEQRVDGGGYRCATADGAPLPVDTRIQLSGDEEGVEIDLPFAFPFYDGTETKATLSTNGALSFDGWVAHWANSPLPGTTKPDGGIYPFWDDLELDAESSVWTGTAGAGEDRRFVVEWRNAGFFAGSARITFQAVLGQDGTITFHYRDLGESDDSRGEYASIGIEAPDGRTGFGWSYGRKVITENLTVTFRRTA